MLFQGQIQKIQKGAAGTMIDGSLWKILPIFYPLIHLF